MIKIGIDFSINSTAVTINKNNNFTFFSFVPNYKTTLKAFSTHEKISEYVTIVSYSKLSNDKNPIQEQINKLTSAENLSNEIIKILKIHIDDEVEFRIEGFSYGSSGNSFIDLIVYNTFLKAKLLKEYGVNSIKVIAPKTNKKLYTGNGNANKCDMVRKFGKEDLIFSRFLVEKEYVKEGNYQVDKPVDDLADSFALSVIELTGCN
jgi:disulfide oxidoreductase YuzD